MSTSKVLNSYKTKLDFMNARIFNFKRANLLHKMYDPLNVKYLRSPSLGNFRIPVNPKNREIRHLVYNWNQAQAYTNHFSYKGYLPTITSNFPKPTNNSTDFNECKVIFIKSGKALKKNQLKFLVDLNLTKPEIVQIIQKLYGIKVLGITTAILPGEVKYNNFKSNGEKFFYRKPDKKVATIDIDFKVDYKHNQLINSINNHLYKELNGKYRLSNLYYDQKHNCMKLEGERKENLRKHNYKTNLEEENEKKNLYIKSNNELLSSIIPKNRKLLLEMDKIQNLDNLSEFLKSKINK